MTIVASADIADYGPKDGKPVRYRFRSIYHLQGIMPWLVLVALFFAFKRNRCPQALWIFVPIAVLAVGFAFFKAIIRVPSGSAVELNGMFTVLVGGFAALWLPAHRLEKLSFPAVVLVLHILYLGFLGITVLSGIFGNQTGQFTGFMIIAILPILWGLTVAGIRCRGTFKRTIFYLWSVGGIFVFMLGTTMIAAFLLIRVKGYHYERIISEIFMFVSIFTLIIAVCLGPFLLVLWKTNFWRRRFDAVFKTGSSKQAESFDLYRNNSAF